MDVSWQMHMFVLVVLHLKWGYPLIIHLNGVFPHKPTIFGYPIYGNPHLIIDAKSVFECVAAADRKSTIDSMLIHALKLKEILSPRNSQLFAVDRYQRHVV